ncbi:MAG TPA: hypothetical protein VGN04_12260 [Herbaspirillum sp.]|jgi:hypothetical protein
MEHEAMLAEMQALLASLKSLSEPGEGDVNIDATPPPDLSSASRPARQHSRDLLPDHRSLRRFILMV